MIKKIALSLLLILTLNTVYAAPLWTFTPLTATTVTVAANGTEVIQYAVTNQSSQEHFLFLQAIPGVTQLTSGGTCDNPFSLGAHQTCTLSLQVDGSAMAEHNAGGPIICESNNPLQCYQPSLADSLNMTQGPAVYTLGGTVSGLADGESLALQNNGGDNKTISSNGSFTFDTSLNSGSPYNTTVFIPPNIQTCVVSNGSGTMGEANVTNISVSCTTNTTTLSISISDLALSQTGHTEYGVSGTPSSGTARTMTLTNTGSYATANLSIDYPTWPSGTTASSNCSTVLSSGNCCTITITPGSTATSDGSNACTTGTAPVAGVISISADNTNTVTSNVVVLGYGCIYNGGYVYALDDTAATSASVGGKVAAPSAQSSGIRWSSSSSNTYDGGVAIYGISQSSTTVSPNPSSGQVAGQTACTGANDGACNANNIYVYYQTTPTGHPINTAYYAAGLCTATINSYSDWYLPAICELGYDNPSAGTGCGTSNTPTLQNMQSNLVDYNSLNLLTGNHWSSTELSASPAGSAWRQLFDTSGGSMQVSGVKISSIGIRCSRAF